MTTLEEKKRYRLSSGEDYFSGKGVGEDWERMGKVQFDFLRQQGLKPSHTLLDIGCGSLRAGVHFVQYLEDNHYYGVDKQNYLLVAAREVELPKFNIDIEKVNLLQSNIFEFGQFNQTFDYVLAQSVFTHLSWNSILRCLVNLQKVLASKGVFYATFIEDKQGDHKISEMTRPFTRAATTFPDCDPFHYEFNVFEELAKRTHLAVEYIGDWGHPRGQKMMLFTQGKGVK